MCQGAVSMNHPESHFQSRYLREISDQAVIIQRKGNWIFPLRIVKLK